MALTTEGELYGWGAAPLAGIGGNESVHSPTRVRFPRGSEGRIPIDTERGVTVTHVACGGAFTLAVLSTGSLVSWGCGLMVGLV
jgi:alpha-tubulin suppressor-like RCC1 family protein